MSNYFFLDMEIVEQTYREKKRKKKRKEKKRKEKRRIYVLVTKDRVKDVVEKRTKEHMLIVDEVKRKTLASCPSHSVEGKTTTEFVLQCWSQERNIVRLVS